jgi:putative phosphoesterase
MKIGVVADTHSLEVPKQLVDDFKKVDLIIHVGDFCCPEDFKFFKDIKETKAVYGNMDGANLRKVLPEKQILEIESVRIGLFHGEGPAKNVLESVKQKFKKDKVDMVIFGHSHTPLHTVIDNVLYFNPGSPNDITFAPYKSYGMLNVNEGTIKAKIIKVKG